MNKLQALKNSLDQASEYFDSRGFSDWSKEAIESIKLLDSGDKAVVEKLLLKYSPTCEVESLYITEYDEDTEELVVEMNKQLTVIINKVHRALESFSSDYT